MSFEKQRRVAEIWAWLPTFRAAAEFESLQRASLALGLSVSAVSRAIKQLEDGLGFAVFQRHATGVTLTPRGANLLSATRLSMRAVDDAMVEGDGVWRVGAVGPFLPALAAHWVPEPHVLLRATGSDALPSLQRGQLDVVLTTEPSPGELFASTALGALDFVRAVPRGVDAAAEVSESTDDLHAMVTLAQRRGQGVVMPRALLPGGWRAESAPRREVLAVYRTGNRERLAALLAALVKGLESAPGR